MIQIQIQKSISIQICTTKYYKHDMIKNKKKDILAHDIQTSNPSTTHKNERKKIRAIKNKKNNERKKIM